MRIKRIKVLLGVCGIFAAFIALCGCWMYFVYHDSIEAPVYSKGPNAVWAAHQWVDRPHAGTEYESFFKKLEANRITDVYVHVGPWDVGAGDIDKSTYLYAPRLLAQAHEHYPHVRVHAWIGQLTTSCNGPLDLSDRGNRSAIAQTASELLSMGFDGIHYDFEPIESGDHSYIDLLVRTKRITRQQGGVLSVASGHLELAPGSGGAIRAFAPCAGIWTDDYFKEVASHADQIAVMLYDTGLPADWMYGLYVKKQTAGLVSLLKNKATLLLGVPTYEERSPGHRPKAENMTTAIKGIQLGLRQLNENENPEIGVAVYADWTTDELEWKTYRRHWLGQ